MLLCFQVHHIGNLNGEIRSSEPACAYTLGRGEWGAFRESVTLAWVQICQGEGEGGVQVCKALVNCVFVCKHIHDHKNMYKSLPHSEPSYLLKETMKELQFKHVK